MDIEALYKKGFDLRCEGRYDEAKVEFTKALQQDPAHLGSLHQLALIEGFEGDFDGSVASLEKLARQYPRDLDLRYDLAMTQMMIGMNDEACAHFKWILSVDPNHAKAKQQVIYC